MLSKVLFLTSFLSVFGFASEFNEKSCCPDSFEEKITPNDMRYKTFVEAFNLMKQRNAKILVETGTARDGKYNCKGDGCSTILFAEWAAQNNAFLYSVDINKDYLDTAARDLGAFSENVQLVHSDSVQFLNNFNQTIDFLYLDSFDFDRNNPHPSQKHHLKEIIAVYPFLTNDTIIMIDDCGLPHGGKGKLAIEYLLNRDWKIVADAYQVILIHADSMR